MPIAGHHGVPLVPAGGGQQAEEAAPPAVTGQQQRRLPPEVTSRGAVHQHVAGEVRQAQRLDHLARLQVLEQVRPGGVGAHLPVAEVRGAHGEGQLQVGHQRGRQLRHHQEETDGQQRHRGRRAAAPAPSTPPPLLTLDDAVPRQADDVTQDEDVEDEDGEGQGGEDEHVHAPAPGEGQRDGLPPQGAQLQLRHVGPQVGLGRGQGRREERAQSGGETGSPHRAPLLLEEGMAHGHVALHGEGGHQENGQVLGHVEQHHEHLTPPGARVHPQPPRHVQRVQQVQQQEGRVRHRQPPQVHRRRVVSAHAPAQPDGGGERVA